MKKVKTAEAVGLTLAHDLTQIVIGEFKGARFKKGHIIAEEDIPVLLSMGKDHIFVWEDSENLVHENEGALRLFNVCRNDHIVGTDIKEGKIEAIADADGLLKIDVERLNAINRVPDVMIATRHGNFPVMKGDKIAGMRVIPLCVDIKYLEEVEKIAGAEPIFKILPFENKRVGIINTGNEIFYGRIEDAFGPKLKEKLLDYPTEVVDHVIVQDETQSIADSIEALIDKGAEIILCTGGMSVDPDDLTPTAIKATGADIVTYGAPVLPGAMCLLAYKDDVTILGLPGCVMYAKRTIFDIILPRVLAGEKLTKEDFVLLGHGGLCLNCEVCTYPNCGFGK